jgi:hypothetical protein
MNFELTVAESFDSLGHFISHCISIFLTSNSCECPHRLLDLIVKERDSLGCRGMRILRLPDSESSTFYCVRSGAFRPGWHRCSAFSRSACFAVSARRHYREIELSRKQFFRLFSKIFKKQMLFRISYRLSTDIFHYSLF